MDVNQLEKVLLEQDFYIESIEKIDHGHRIRLGCRAVISLYDTGTVLLQGNLHPQSRKESLPLLRQILPPDTRWCLK